MASLSQAIAVRKVVDTHTYVVHLSDEWTIGTVPNGGYVSSCFLSVAKQHFATVLKSYDQPDTIVLHNEFLRRTAVGEAIFKVQDLKLGRRTSTLQILLYQGSDDRKPKVLGQITNTNLSKESGLSLPTQWSLRPPPPPVDLRKLVQNCDNSWKLLEKLPFPDFRRATNNLIFYLPRVRAPQTAVVDEWIRMKNNERFRLESLGLVNDMFPQLVDVFHPEGQPSYGKNWYPTLVLNLDIKKSLPPDGVEILFVRVQAKSIKNGRFDLELTILDEEGNIVAVGHHVALILSASRNVAGRGNSGQIQRSASENTKSVL